MASRLHESCSPLKRFLAPGVRRLGDTAYLRLAWPLIGLLLGGVASAQMLLKPSQPGETVNLMPSDLTILEASQDRKDLPCSVTQRKAELGFDLRFHAGFDVSVPLDEVVRQRPKAYCGLPCRS